MKNAPLERGVDLNTLFLHERQVTLIQEHFNSRIQAKNDEITVNGDYR